MSSSMMSTLPAAANLVGSKKFGDTTYTKVFVGGLAWETQKETLKKHFDQFGEILEAVVITDKATGRSKGYGFVTFREAEAAMSACVDVAPVIDGRRANCNLASLGGSVHRSKNTNPSTPNNIIIGTTGCRNFKVTGGGVVGSAFPSAAAATLPYYAIHHGILPYLYGYSSYSQDYSYPTSYYNVYGGATPQYQVYGSVGAASVYPSSYLHYGEGCGGYEVNYPPHQLFQYSPLTSNVGGYAPHYATPPLSLPPSPPMQSACFAVPQA